MTLYLDRDCIHVDLCSLPSTIWLVGDSAQDVFHHRDSIYWCPSCLVHASFWTMRAQGAGCSVTYIVIVPRKSIKSKCILASSTHILSKKELLRPKKWGASSGLLEEYIYMYSMWWERWQQNECESESQTAHHLTHSMMKHHVSFTTCLSGPLQRDLIPLKCSDSSCRIHRHR